MRGGRTYRTKIYFVVTIANGPEPVRLSTERDSALLPSRSLNEYVNGT